MTTTFARDDLASALPLLLKATDRRSRVPILAHVWVRAGADSAVIYATDMETAATAHIAASGTGGNYVLPARALLAFVKSCPKGATIDVTAGETIANLACGGATATLPTLSVDDFPRPGFPAKSVDFTMPAADLARLFSQVQHAVSTEGARYYLCGALLQCWEASLRAVALDGHQLAVTDVALPAGLAGNPFADGIVPTAAVTLILSALGKAKGDVTVSVADTRIRVSLGNIEIASKLIDGTFPEYERVIPRENANVLTADAGEITAAASAFIAGSTERGVPMAFDLVPGDGCAVSASKGNGAVSAHRLNGITRYAGKAMRLGLQARYVRAALGPLSGEVQIAVRDPKSPVVITSAANPGYLAVVMPICI